MIRLGVAPRVIDIMRGALSTVDSWFNGVTARFNLTQKAGIPVLAEVPTNQWGIFKNTSTSDVALYVNDNGTLKSMLAYTFPITVTGGFSLNFTVTGITSVTLPTTGTLATLAGVETLTNKTLTLPKIAQISNTGTLTLPTSTDTLVGKATTDTLTNKTLTAPVIATIVNTGTLTLPTATDTLVGRTTTDTLTNKTLTSPVISTIVNTGTLTLPTSTDTLVGKATTDTLTNKTLTTPVINGTVTGTGVATTDVANTLVQRDASGNFTATTVTANLTGNADTATKLLSARNINGVLFDGTADITVTAAAGTVTGTTLNPTVVTSSLTTVGTIGTGTWQGTVVAGQYGGTGVANTGKTITLGGNLTTSGAFATTFTMTGITTVTFPTTGTLTTTTGTGATGTWGISISGNAATATTATSATSATTAGSVTNSVTFNNAGTGGASGSTYNGGSVLTVSYNTLGAAPLASPTFTGVPAAPTAAVDTNTTQLATTGFVIGQATGTTPLINGTAAVGSETKFARGNHVHPTDTTRAPLASPTFTGTVTAPTLTSTTGTITNLTATTLNSGQLAGFRNKIINGGMAVGARPNATLTTSSSAFGQVDRMLASVSGTTVSAVVTQAFVSHPSATGYATQVGNVTTTGATSISLLTRLVSTDTLLLSGNTVTFSGRVYQDTGSSLTAQILIYKANTTDNFSATTLLFTSGGTSIPTSTWTSINASYTLGATEADNGLQIVVFYPTVGAVSVKQFYFTDFQLEQGSVATSFEHRHIELDRLLCQRFWRTTAALATPLGGGSGSLTGVASATTVLQIPYSRTPMRAVPTRNIYNNGVVGQVRVTLSGATVALGTITSFGGNSDSSVSFLTTSAGVLTVGTWYDFDLIEDAEL